MYNIKNLHIFLKRIVNPEIKTSTLYLGSEITIYSGQYKIIAYADEFTKKALEEILTSSFAIILNQISPTSNKIINLFNMNNNINHSLNNHKNTSYTVFNQCKRNANSIS